MIEGKKIVIFSPQPWDHIYISKHHYALELAKKNHVWYISAPENGPGFGHKVSELPGSSLKLIKYKMPLPSVLKFRFPAIYRLYSTYHLRKLLSRTVGMADVCIDFGCYQLFASMNFVAATKKVYFPVDDFQNLKASTRGADRFFSVSTNVIEKFRRSGIVGRFINHGLGDVFVSMGKARLAHKAFNSLATQKIRVAYSGHLFISFLDIAVFRQIITENAEVEFHFFGATRFDRLNPLHVSWNDFLEKAPNVVVHGIVSPEQLSRQYESMDAFILCYQPDYKNYHGENSHKILEYLSTGKVLVSTFITLYDGNGLINMAPKDQNGRLVSVFGDTMKNIELYNRAELQEKRIQLALDNSYQRQIERIFESIG